MEWDSQGLQDKEIAAVQKRKGCPRRLAPLTPQGKASRIRRPFPDAEAEITRILQARQGWGVSKPLSVNHELDPERVFRDYRQNGGNFEHLDNPFAQGAGHREVRFTYTPPGRDAPVSAELGRFPKLKRSLVRDCAFRRI